jgi:hypothetical protein
MLKQLGVEHAKGGNVDDITVFVSKVATREDMLNTTMW